MILNGKSVSLWKNFKSGVKIRDSWRPPIATEFRACATGVTGKIVAASATVAVNDIYLAFQIFQSCICNVINLFMQKEKG
jgi:hypothetical protein